jgi:NACHT domain
VRCIFWLNGLAGTGKSTIARTVAHTFFEQKRLGASFFFSKGVGDVSHAGKFFTSLAVQLALNVPSLRQYICEAVTKRSDIASLSLSEQWRQLVLSPLSNLQSESCQSYILIVDALDECEDNEDVRIILQLLAEARSLTVRLRVFLTSRPEIPIRHGIYHIPQAEHQDFILHNVPPTIVNHDISLFLEHNLGIIRQEWTLGADWPGEVALGQLVLYACGLFIWAATACRFIREGKRFARKRLDTILKGSSSTITVPEKYLNEIYLTVLKHSISSEYLDEEKEEVYDILKQTLGSIVVLFSPLSTYSLSKLLDLPKEDVDRTFEDLYAILDISEDPTRPLRLHHPSFRDFLLNKDRCGDFWVDEKKAHQILAAGCIQLMSQTLKKDICEMDAPGSQASQAESSWIEKCLPPEVQYACLYWIQHLQRSSSPVHDDEEAHLFLEAHLLHWLEALGWIGKASEGIQAILSLEAHVPVSYLSIVCRSLTNLSLG